MQKGGPAAKPALFTTGYEGRVQDELLDSLIAAGARLLLDVRAVPLSRKPGFSKKLLAASAEARGLRYIHIVSLGTPKPGRDAARAGRAADMAAIFATHMATPAAQQGLSLACDLAAGTPICLLCFERDPHLCHRSIVARMIAERTGQMVTHI